MLLQLMCVELVMRGKDGLPAPSQACTWPKNARPYDRDVSKNIDPAKWKSQPRMQANRVITQRFFHTSSLVTLPVIVFHENALTRESTHAVFEAMVRRFCCPLSFALAFGLLPACATSESTKPSPSSSSSGDPMPMGPSRIAYGSRPEQFGDLRVPKGGGPFPVVVVIHGGCWVNFYGLDLMHEVSDVLTAQGLATWNIEYRRIGDAESNYPNTMLDVGLAIDHLRKIAAEHRLDLAKVTTIGHSAGGHLAMWAAARAKLDNQNPLHGADPLPIRASVALAGVLDLAESINLGVCNGTAGKLMQGTPAEVPAHYAESSPKELLPLPVPQRLIHGNADTLVPVIMSQHYLDAAKAAGDVGVTLNVIEDADHFDMITPSSSKWPEVMKIILEVAR